MAIVVDPIDASGGAPSYTAQQLRQARGALVGLPTSTRPLGARSGVRAGTPSTTVFLSGGGSTTWNVAAHSGVLDTESPVAAGPYQYATDGADTGTITAANATNPRIDVIWVAVNDTVQDGSGLRGGVVTYQAGTAAASPVAPTPTNARALVLAQINVPVSGGGAPTVTWVAPYTAASGGIIPARSSTDYPASPYEGLYADDAALDLPMRYNGTAWVPLTAVPSIQQLAFTPGSSVSTSTSAGTLGWAVVGTVTVPAWATKAAVSYGIDGIAPPATTGNTKVGVQIGSVNGAIFRMTENAGAASGRFPHFYNDLITGIATGSQTVRLVTQWTAASAYAIDTNSVFSALFTFLP